MFSVAKCSIIKPLMDFSLLDKEVFKKIMIYLDNSATTIPCKTAVEYINKSLTENSLFVPILKIKEQKHPNSTLSKFF